MTYVFTKPKCLTSALVPQIVLAP